MSLKDLHLYDIRGGKLNETPFAALMGLALHKKITGSFQVERNKVRKDIYFLNGMPVFAKSDMPSESLRQSLLKSGKIKRSVLEKIEWTMKNEKIDEDKALLDMDIIDDSDRYSHLQKLARTRILSCFQWSSGKYKFNPGEFFLNYIDLFDMSPLDVIHEGISTYQNLDLAAEIQDVAQLEVKATENFCDVDAFLERYHPESDISFLCNEKIKVFDALPLIGNDINYSLTFVYVLLVTGYLALNGHLPGDCAPDIDEPYEGVEDETAEAAPPPPEADTEPKKPLVRVKKYIPKIKDKKSLEAPTPPKRFQKKKLRAYGQKAPEKKSIKTKIQHAGPIDKDLLNRFEMMAEKINEGDYYDMLGVTIDTPRAEVKKAFFLKNQQFHADRARSLGPEGLALSQEITDELHKVSQILADPDKRYKWEMETCFKDEMEKAWSIKLRLELAKKQYRRGKWYLTNRRPDYAFNFFDSAGRPEERRVGKE